MTWTADAHARHGRDDPIEEHHVRGARLVQPVIRPSPIAAAARRDHEIGPSFPAEVVPVSSVTVSSARTTVVPTAMTRTPARLAALMRSAVAAARGKYSSYGGSWLSRLATPVCSTQRRDLDAARDEWGDKLRRERAAG